MDSGRGNLRRRRRAPLGCAREREQRARERAVSEGEKRGGRGEVRGVHSRVGEAAEAGGGAGACRRAANTRPASLWRPSGARWEMVAALVGWASSWAVVGRQVCPGEGPSGLLSLSYLIVSVFLFFRNFRALLKILKLTQKS